MGHVSYLPGINLFGLYLFKKTLPPDKGHMPCNFGKRRPIFQTRPAQMGTMVRIQVDITLMPAVLITDHLVGGIINSTTYSVSSVKISRSGALVLEGRNLERYFSFYCFKGLMILYCY
jgi:hypothetical protein